MGMLESFSLGDDPTTVDVDPELNAGLRLRSVCVPTIKSPTVTIRETSWRCPNGWATFPAGTAAEPVRDIASEWHESRALYESFIEGIRHHKENGRGMVAVKIEGKVRMIERDALR